MQLLTAHLRDPDDHGRLPFHPECPICRRERLVGVLPPERIISRRTQALLASGVLALSAAAPSAVLAAEPDQEQEGSAAPDQVAAGDPAASPDFDPGGDSTDLPFDEGPPPQAQPAPGPSSDEADSLDEEPAVDTAAPIADAGDEATAPGAQEQPSAPAQAVPSPPTQPEQPPAASVPPASAPPPEAPAAVPTPPPEPKRIPVHKPRKAPSVESRKHDTIPTNTVTSPTSVEVAQAPQAASAPVGGGARTEPGDRSHVVHAGESLWSIASDLLGGEASAARIAREVNRLWELNKVRIGTGDPDLLMVGTKLRLG
jgi:nucleoid-associated protein YgaU